MDILWWVWNRWIATRQIVQTAQPISITGDCEFQIPKFQFLLLSWDGNGPKIKWCKWYSKYLGHHASPCDYIRIYLASSFLLMWNDGFQQAVEMFSFGIVMLHKSIESKRQIRAKLRGIIVFYGWIVRAIFMILIIREARKLLFRQTVSYRLFQSLLFSLSRIQYARYQLSARHSFSQVHVLTLGRLTGWLSPTNRITGSMEKLEAIL